VKYGYWKLDILSELTILRTAPTQGMYVCMYLCVPDGPTFSPDGTYAAVNATNTCVTIDPTPVRQSTEEWRRDTRMEA
jgi:hypothetical protein